ncbi:hypothetical protein TREMEDRAFT_59343 [Tremella mesenterica DSM 1558]|uniref:uncharacterized protein n=1 Tax=Tremella mesenterica (strain ATCC 24925 / CBS 8224 / DSM 1558 / NBRC 9311 / NRRL Y-6157 / RJB 2259-6 / UBC 559-6) TaxID=578456 RepID=UPI0003F48EAC|nr:uncharacterized protein TREMEDRAFT_59343 [Tremella mesenterica DSM 1558]EIW73181.1 hypothetical protein TREMEDRAFT_59343 [Tremella mesenterica DSM 1558]
MEQAPNLITSALVASPSGPPSPTPDKGPATSSDLSTAPPNHPEAAQSDQVPTHPPEGNSVTDPTDSSSWTTVERAFQHGLDRENFEQEVGQVMGTFNNWWGGVKKQSASALQIIKADIDKTITVAQQDLEYLRGAKVEVIRKDSSEIRAEREERVSKSESEDKGKGKEGEGEQSSPKSEDTSKLLSTSASSLFNRLSISASQIQSTLQSTISSATTNPTLSNPSQLRAQLAENLRLSSARQNLQLSMKQAEKLAEEYLKKGDQWVKDAEKWMEEAVKIVPPESDRMNQNVMFDSRDKTPRNSMSGVVLAGSRKEALLRRLREDKDLLLVDPEGEGESMERKEEFRKWVEEDWEKEGSKGREEEEGHVGGVRMALVPEQLTDEQFWQRYLFHKHMIEAEDEKRKKLLQASQQVQEDFSWDDETDETPPSSAPLAQSTSTLKPHPSPKKNLHSTQTEDLPTPKPQLSTTIPAHVQVSVKSGTSTQTSPRDSEESYDLVSDQGQKPKPPVEDEESDWE